MSVDLSHFSKIIATDGAGLCYDKYEVSNLSDSVSYQNLDYVVILGVEFNSTGSLINGARPLLGYYMKIYYNSQLIYDSGTDDLVDDDGNPVNWPPPASTYEDVDSNYGGQDIVSASALNNSGSQSATQDFYILPDIHYDSIKNGITFPNSNTTIENTIQAGSHFALGSHQETRFLVGANAVIKSYYGITKLNSPPTIYRNTLAVDDGGVGSDEDFNDAIFVLKKGDGFFTGETIIGDSSLGTGGIGTGNLTTTQYSYPGGTNQDWSKTYNTFVANTTGRYEFQVKRDAGRKNKILLHPGTGTASGTNGGSSTQSSNWAIIEPGNSDVSTVNVTLDNLQAGTYEVALRSDNVTRNGARLHVRHIDINKYPTIRPGT